jgi:peptidoglycan/LPS O-acetylase OafA/YrhL
MATNRISAIEYIRGIGMLGVIGIHAGAFSISNPHVNIHLFALLDILTRFCVPIFFFASAFGLFINYKQDAPFSYGNFIKRRLHAVLIPYIVWSLLYMVHATLITGETWQWSPRNLLEHFLFGLASYQLYFLVILVWFYLLMPLWRSIIPFVINKPVKWLSILLVAQIAFNYYSSYLITTNFSSSLVNLLVKHRMSYLVLHYVFIFIFGAVCAARYQDLLAWARRHIGGISVFFLVSIAGMLIPYYWLVLANKYTPVEAVSIIHQLSPVGVLNTLGSSLFLLTWFSLKPPSKLLAYWGEMLGFYSYPVYLVHPFFMYYLNGYLESHGIIMTAKVVIAFYCATVALSLLAGILINKLNQIIPAAGVLLLGKAPAIKKSNPGT